MVRTRFDSLSMRQHDVMFSFPLWNRFSSECHHTNASLSVTKLFKSLLSESCPYISNRQCFHTAKWIFRKEGGLKYHDKFPFPVLGRL